MREGFEEEDGKSFRETSSAEKFICNPIKGGTTQNCREMREGFEEDDDKSFRDNSSAENV
jgi:hypothetical protein